VRGFPKIYTGNQVKQAALSLCVSLVLGDSEIWFKEIWAPDENKS